jgi:ribonuclease BN (tRNA processing enzyme)
MFLHCLGTTGFHPSATRHTACYYLPELGLVFDAGTGIFRIIEELLNRPRESLTIVLSHAHLDHVVGLTFLVDALAVTALQRIRLIGEAAKLDVVRKHLYHDLLFPVAPAFDFLPLPAPAGSMDLELDLESGSFVSNQPVKLSWFPLEHPGRSTGYCLEIGPTKLAYVTDTTARPDAEYLRHLGSTDLLLHECYFDDQDQHLAEKTGHSWLSAVAQVVRLLEPRQTALIHINPLAEILGREIQLSDAHRQELKMFVAEDGMHINF